jgi:hypothetical protein
MARRELARFLELIGLTWSSSGPRSTTWRADRIVGVSPVYDRTVTTRDGSTGETFFDRIAAMIPTAFLGAEGSSLRVASVTRVGGDPVSTELTIRN